MLEDSNLSLLYANGRVCNKRIKSIMKAGGLHITDYTNFCLKLKFGSGY
jgi:hypothetical protein